MYILSKKYISVPSHLFYDNRGHRSNTISPPVVINSRKVKYSHIDYNSYKDF